MILCAILMICLFSYLYFCSIRDTFKLINNYIHRKQCEQSQRKYEEQKYRNYVEQQIEDIIRVTEYKILYDKGITIKSLRRFLEVGIEEETEVLQEEEMEEEIKRELKIMDEEIEASWENIKICLTYEEQEQKRKELERLVKELFKMEDSGKITHEEYEERIQEYIHGR